MEKKVAIVTGSEGEIAQAICKKLISDDFRVIGIDVQDCPDDNFYTHYLQGSVIDPIVVTRCFELVSDLSPGYLALINAAAITAPNDLSMESWDATIATNLTAPFIWMSKAADFFEIQKIGGSIVSITSLSAEFAFPNNPAYAASKGGLRQLTKSFAHRLGKLGINCNNVAPGYIETEFNAQSIRDKKRYLTRAQHSLLQRWGKPGEVADLVQFLCSENARFITGQDVFVDGGWSAQGLIEYE
jgi:NAD(P)-dependent dehydrogenase (short-subunit alcohol dehydrogenase family)